MSVKLVERYRALGAALIPSKSPLTLKRNHDLILIRHYAVSYPLSFFQIEISRRKPYPAYTYLFKLLINFFLHPIKVIIRHGRSPSFNITDHGFAPAQSLRTFEPWSYLHTEIPSTNRASFF
jgi:hypothetical protein